MLRGGWRSLGAMTLVLSSVATTAAADELAAQATTALDQAVTFLREQVAVRGSFLWKYTPDLERRWGEHLQVRAAHLDLLDHAGNVRPPPQTPTAP